MATFQNIKQSLSDNKSQLILLSVFSIVMVFFCSKMSPLYIINDWSDINLYFNISKAMCNGQTLYADVFDHKGPAIFFIYAAGYLISNDSFFGMFVIECLAWIILSFTAYYTARLFLNKIYSLLSALFFLPFFLSHSMDGGSAEEFLAVGMAISLYFFIRYFQNPRKHSYKVMLIHGMMWGVVLLTKFNLTTFWIFPLLAIAIILVMKKEYKNLILNILFFILGGAIVIVPIIIYFIANNALQDAINSYITVNSSVLMDAQAITFYTAVRFYQRLKFETFDFSIILIGAAIFPLVLIKNNIAKLGIMGSFGALFVAIFMSDGYVYYYSIPYYIYVTTAFILTFYLLRKYFKANIPQFFSFILAGMLLGYSISEKNFFNIPKDVLLRKEKPQGTMFQFADVISREEQPTLMNLGLDQVNAVFTYLNLMPNIKYFITPNLGFDRYPDMRNKQTEYIRDKKIMFIVINDESGNYEYFTNLYALNQNYEVVDTSQIFSEWSNRMTTSYLYKVKD